MKHIVFVIGYYFPEAGSTSLCAIKIMNDLLKRYDVTISCVCGTNEKTGVECVNKINLYRIHHISYTDSFDKTATKAERSLVRTNKLIKDISNIYHYPDMDWNYSKEIFAVLDRIETTCHIDSIVAVYMPKQSISGVLLFKEKYPDVHTIAYFLDTLRSNRPKLLPWWIHTKMIDIYENKIFSIFDKIILMKYGAGYYSNQLLKKYKDKISLLGLPSLEILKLNIKDSKGKKCSYVGTTYLDIRNPMFALRVFDAVHRIDDSVFFQIYGPSNMKEDLIEWQTQHRESFYYHDFINHEEIISIYEDSDYVVSIGNTLKGVVPGKTFEIFGTLKPIIHFTDVTNDSSLEFIKKYPNVCIIDYHMGVQEAANYLLTFLSKPYQLCDPLEIENKFYFAKPDAVSDIIYETIKYPNNVNGKEISK